MSIQKRLLLEQIDRLKASRIGTKVMRGAMPETVEEDKVGFGFYQFGSPAYFENAISVPMGNVRKYLYYIGYQNPGPPDGILFVK